MPGRNFVRNALICIAITAPTAVAAADPADPLKVLAPPILPAAGAAYQLISTPALGGQAFVITITPAGANASDIDVRWAWGHWRTEWRRNGELRLPIDSNMVAAMDRELGAIWAGGPTPAPKAEAGMQAIWVCADGPGYLLQRSIDGRITRFTSTCGDDRLDRMAAVMLVLVGERAGLAPSTLTSQQNSGR